MASTTTVGPHPLAMLLTFAGNLVALMALSGCASAGTPAVGAPTQHAAPSTSQQQTQVIVKFKDPTLDPNRQDYLRELAHGTGVALVYIRPMSGGAHVLQVDGAVDAGHFQRIVDELSKRPGVEYAEADRRMHPMPRR